MEGNKVAKSIASEDYWADSNTLGTPGNDTNSNNQSGFNSTPGGSRDGNGYWQASGDFSLMWTSDNKAAKLLKFSVDLGITDGASDKWGYYIRLIKVCNL